MQQRDLFGNLQPEAKLPEVSYPWSHSRIGALNSCPRKYFHQYYSSKKRTAKEFENKERLAFLSHLATKHLIAGTIIHDCIDHFFKSYRKGINYNLDMLLRFALEKLEAAFRLTESAKKNNAIDLKTNKIFKELFYNTVDAPSFKKELKGKISICITNFFTAPEFKDFREGGKLKSAQHEKWVIFKLMGYASIKGKLDLSYDSTTGDNYIVDWKTGGVENEETSLQLLIYAIWVIENGGIDPAKVKLFKAYLFENKVESLALTEDQLLRAKMRVIQDTEGIEKLHPYGLKGTEAAFTKIEYPNYICPQCPYEEICHKIITNGNKYQDC